MKLKDQDPKYFALIVNYNLKLYYSECNSWVVTSSTTEQSDSKYNRSYSISHNEGSLYTKNCAPKTVAEHNNEVIQKETIFSHIWIVENDQAVA